MEKLYSWAQSCGFILSSIELDGHIHRFDRDGKNNAWYVGYQAFRSKSGEPYYILILGDWKTGEKHTYKPDRLSKEDSAVYKIKVEEAKNKFEEERKEKNENAKSFAQKLIKRCRPVFSSAYLTRKKISELHGALTTMDEESGERIIVVPMVNKDGELCGAQRIWEDGTKRFLFGQQISGLFHVMGPLDSDSVYIAEGFATAASIREITGKTVVVAFNAGNLKHVALAIRSLSTTKAITICGDDDTKTEGNPGRTKAEEAARLVGGIAVFPPSGFVDFNDAFVAGVDINFGPEPDHIGFTCLGVDETRCFFYVHQTKMVCSTSTLSNDFLFHLMPNDYWAAMYPTEKGHTDWAQVKSDLTAECKKMGRYDPNRIRGVGVWLDNGSVVVNTGKEEIKSKNHVYISSTSTLSIHKNPLTITETKHLLSACENLRWKDERSAYYLAGWLALARIAGALPVRPHIWVTGSSGSGKSTVMERIVATTLGNGKFYFQGGSTEAGVRQTVKANAIPIIFDEFETTDDNSKTRTAALIELLRQSWSKTGGNVVKGSAGGSAVQYALSFAGLVSSVRTGLTNDADKSRFTLLELESHGSNKEHWARIKQLLKPLTEEYGERLFSRQIAQVPTIIKNYETISSVLAEAVSMRFGQQHGMLMAGWYSLTSDDLITESAARSIVDDLELVDAKEDAELTDEVECLQWLLDYNKKVIGETGFSKVTNSEKAIRVIIDDNDPAELRQLPNIGVRYENQRLLVSSNHAMLKKYVFKGTRWENCWHQTLQRIPGAEKTGSIRFGVMVSRAISVPLVTNVTA